MAAVNALLLESFLRYFLNKGALYSFLLSSLRSKIASTKIFYCPSSTSVLYWLSLKISVNLVSFRNIKIFDNVISNLNYRLRWTIVLGLGFTYCYLTNYKLFELFLVLLIVVENCLDFWKGLRSLKFIDLMCKSICSHIALKSELQFSNYPLVYGNLKSDIWDGNGFGEPALNFQNPKLLWVCLFMLFHICCYVLYRLNNILDFHKCTQGISYYYNMASLTVSYNKTL